MELFAQIGFGVFLLVCGLVLIHQAFEAQKSEGSIAAFCFMVGVIAVGSGSSAAVALAMHAMHA